METQLIKYPVADAEIAKFTDHYQSLTIEGVEDKAGLKIVSEARKHMKSLRVQVDRKRKELNAEALKHQRAVNGEAKRLIALIEPTEGYLQLQEDDYTREVYRMEEAERVAKAMVLKSRLDQLCAVGKMLPSYEVEKMEEPAFDALLAEATDIFEMDQAAREEEERLIEEAKASRARAEEEAQAVRVKEQADLEAKFAEEQRIADLERKAFEEERAEFEKEKALVAQAKAKADAKAAAKALRKEEEKTAKAEAKLAADLLPHAEKLEAYALEVEACAIPPGPYKRHIEECLEEFTDALRSAVE